MVLLGELDELALAHIVAEPKPLLAHARADLDIVSLDYDVIVLLSVATRQLVVSIHYAAQSAARRYANNRLQCVSPLSARLLL